MSNRLESATGGAQAPTLNLLHPGCVATPLVRQSNTGGATISVNDAWLQYTERPVLALLCDAWLEAVHSDDRERVIAIQTEMLGARTPYTLEFRLRHAHAGYRSVTELANPVMSREGAFDGYAHHGLDMHERTMECMRLAEQCRRLRQASQARAAYMVALARELDRLPQPQLRVGLELVARMAHAGAAQPVKRRVADWLGEIGQAVPSSVASLDVLVDPLLTTSLSNALGCLCALEPSCDTTLQLHREDDALIVEMAAMPEASAFLLLALALQWHGETLHTTSDKRWRWRLPLKPP